MKSLLIQILLALFSYVATAQQTPNSLCKACASSNMKKLERVIKKKILKHKKGMLVYNGSTAYRTYNTSYDSIVNWLNRQDCVADAAWDKCQGKLLLYPGSSHIGAVFKTSRGNVEKCFTIREGKVRTINRWFGWIHYFKDRNRMFYVRMTDCDNFVKQQKALCKQESDG